MTVDDPAFMAPLDAECRRLASKIQEILHRGTELDPSALHFIDSTFFNPTVKQLDVLLKAADSTDGDILREFLISPDESLQLELEDLLAAHPLEKREEERVARLLDRSHPAMVLNFPDGRGSLRVELTPPLVRRLLSHLKLAWQPPLSLAAALRAAEAAEEHLRLRVRLRNCRVVWSPETADFMTALLKTVGLSCRQDWECIDFALEFLADIDQDADVSEALDRRKRLLARALQQSRRQKELLEKSNVESLMSCGVRFPHIDEAAVRRQIAHIDRISLAVYGRILELPWADVVEFDTGDASGEGGPVF